MSLIDRIKLDGRVALVTGAAGGMGQAISEELIALGAKVVLADVTARIEKVAEEIGGTDAGADWIRMDVTDSRSVESAVSTVVQRYGKLDILVANAGISYDEETASHTDESWRRVMSVNLDGVFYSIRAAGREMIKRGGGAIVAISSICGVTRSGPEVHIGYDVSKAGVAHMCRNVATEWARHNVRINAVGPGYTETPMLNQVGLERPEVMQTWLDDMPIGRLIAPHEVADAVAFLVSDGASGITGHLLMVDGGYSVA